jgi:AraC-like DNA-binding protein
VLPDGCIDVVWSSNAGTWIAGANTTAFQAALAPGEHVVGARLAPGGAPALLGVPAELVLDQRPPATEILGEPGARLAEQLDLAPDPVALLGTWLQQRAAAAPEPDRLVTETARRLDGSGLSVAGLADQLGVSERALRRRVRSAVGYGPKRLARVLRLTRALAAARGGQELGLIAFEAGYADQAHFCTDCRELAGVSPTALLAE